MAEEVVGRVTIKGTQAEVDALRSFVTKATDLLGQRIDPLTLETRERAQMPVYGTASDGTKLRAEGHWSMRNRLMLCAKDLFDPTPALKRDKTMGHEFVHVLFSDWLGKWHRRQLLPVITPPAEGWNDLTIGDNYIGYEADPSEALACWGSAALFNWERPAYSTLYKRRIMASNFAKTKIVLLATAP